MPTKIPLVNGGFATVSASDYGRLSKFRWYACPLCKHIIRVVKRGTGHEVSYMAAEVIGVDSGVYGACNPCPPPQGDN